MPLDHDDTPAAALPRPNDRSPSPDDPPRPPSWSALALTTAGAALATAVAAVLVLLAPTPVPGLPPLSPAAGIAAGLAVGLSGAWRIAGIAGALVGAVLPGVVLGGSATAGAVTLGGLAVEIALLVVLLGRTGTPLAFRRLRDLARLLSATVVATAAAGAVVAYTLDPLAPSGAAARDLWWGWSAAHTAGIVAAAPAALLAIAALRARRFGPGDVEGALALLVLIPLVNVAFFGRLDWLSPLALVHVVILLPVLSWITLRSPPLYAALSVIVLVVAVVADMTTGTFAATGLFISAEAHVLAAQILLVACGASVMAAALLNDERRQATAALSASERKFYAMYDRAFAFLGILDRDGNLLEANRRALDVAGLKLSDVVGRPFVAAPWWQTSAASRARLAQAIETGRRGRFSRFDVVVATATGDTLDLDLTVTPIFDGAGRVVRLQVEGRDIFALKQSTAALKESEARFRALVALSSDWYWEVDELYRFTSFTSAPEFAPHWTATSRVSSRPWEIPWLGIGSDAWAAHRATLERHEPFRNVELIRPGTDGDVEWVSISGDPVFDEAGRFKGYRGTGRTITQRKQAEQRQELLLALADALRDLDDPRAIGGVAARLLARQLHVARVVYADIDEPWCTVTTGHADGVGPMEGRLDLASFGDRLLEAARSGDVVTIPDVSCDPRVDEVGRATFARFDIAACAGMMVIRGGGPVGGVAVHTSRPRTWTTFERDLLADFTERTWSAIVRARTEVALRESEERSNFAQAAAEVGVWDWDLAENRTSFNDVYYKLYGMTDRQPHGFNEFLARVHPDDRFQVEIAMQQALAGGRVYDVEYRVQRACDGTERWLAAKGKVVRDAADRPLRISGVAFDITDRKRSLDILDRAKTDLEARVAERSRDLEREMRRREEAQAALAQAQRLEALGQLTGGFVHDMNNLLAIVAGHLDIVRPHVTDTRGRDAIKTALAAVEMGADLNRRLLSFARRRELAPVVLAADRHIVELMPMLRQVVGSPITIVTDLAPGLAPTRADPGALQTALLNLAINARDAMPDGGVLTIAACTVTVDDTTALDHPGAKVGPHVRITVRDTGHGMTPEVLRRAVEPFYTTKESGRGTGLGLSSVYGFALQSEGFLTIASTPGGGTTVDLHLPAAVGMPVAPEGEDTTVAVEVPKGHGETILVVEDNDEVRRLTIGRLEALGYVVLDARTGPDAIAVLAGTSGVDLVFSDIMMPGGMTGYDVAAAVRDGHPGVRVLLTSGNDVAERRTGTDHVVVLEKPYTRAVLARAVRDALDVPLS
jgi:PAS domain S-box-containing protein